MKLLNDVERERTYRELYKQGSLSDVLNLAWFKRHKKKFEEENEEVSLMIKRRDVEEVKSPNLGDASAFDEEEDHNMPSFLEKIDKIASEEVEKEKEQPDTYQQLLQYQFQVDSSKRKKEEEENEKLIKQMLEEEQKDEILRNDELEKQSLLEAQRIQKEFEEESMKVREEEEEKNKPECKICFDSIEFDEIVVLGCNHIYHPNCMKFHIKAKVDSKSFPLACPEPE
eukprot:CAMPEP_0205830956 /NCGR_PEP_ID=MMETSP0206-20130828/42604_1 /ASSEMBLY_ACC=CAM_ASM_000279 /TAXON_ID=36767 /ORGANISM="Euplotes focardii, Strain TN1" /LENGTH=226 /DNA_ID=CAMNT_0053135107 /DNA_START=193 /DNA_END=873 /DNA_ORIENTATION=+